MSNYYADCGTSLSNVDTALQAYYTTGLTIHSSSATTLIFSCTGISDKVIKLVISNSQLLAYYGDAYSGGDITNSVTFGGSSTTGTLSKIHLVLTANTLLLNALTSTQNSKIIIVGALTNDAFAVAGMVGVVSIATYQPNHYGKLTASGSNFLLFDLRLDVKSDTGKIYKSPLIIYTVAGGIPLTSGAPVAFRDISTCTRALGQTTVFKGDSYFITTSNMYFDNSEGQALVNSLLVQNITLPA